jgi:hypothetical protein
MINNLRSIGIRIKSASENPMPDKACGFVLDEAFIVFEYFGEKRGGTHLYSFKYYAAVCSTKSKSV